MTSIVLAVSEESADAILSGKRRVDLRSMRPAKLPARAYLAQSGAGGVVGECVLGEAERQGTRWALPISRPRRYKRPRPLASYGLEKTPRSFRYVRAG